MIFDKILDELMTPTGQAGPASAAYNRAMSGGGHAAGGLCRRFDRWRGAMVWAGRGRGLLASQGARGGSGSRLTLQQAAMFIGDSCGIV